jgi:hypothetical protein
MRRSLLAPLGAVVLLSMVTASGYAATPDTAVPATQTAVPATLTSGATLPLACQLDDDVASTTPQVATVTAPVAVAGTDDDDVRDDDGEGMGHRIRACIQALHDAGDHGFGAIVSALAHQEAGHRRDKRDGDDSDASVAAHAVTSTGPVVTGTPTAKARQAEHQGQSDNHGPSNSQPHADDHGHGGDS